MYKLYCLRYTQLCMGIVLSMCVTLASLRAQSVSPITNVAGSPGAGLRNPTSFVAFNGRLYFIADSPVSTTYKVVASTDGTVAGTKLLGTSPIPVYASDTYPVNFTVYNGKLYFVAGDDRELYVTDGTDAGTHLVKDIYVGAVSGNPTRLTATDGKLYFVAINWPTNSNRVLWVSDGTTAGTQRLSDAVGVPVGGADPTELTAVGNKLFYQANADGGIGLWVTDGTAAGTRLVRGGSVVPGSPAPYFTNTPRNFSKLTNEKLIFRAAAAGSEDEPWISNGTSEGTFTPDIVPYPNGSFPNIVPGSPTYSGRFYFTTEQGTNKGLYATDGNAGGTFLIKPGLSQATNFTIFNDRLYFTVLGGALWQTDGSEAGTQAVSGAPAGAQNLTVAGGRLYFTIPGGSPGGALWSTDGSTGGTRRVFDASGILDNRVRSLIRFNDQLFLAAFPPSSSTIPDLFRLNANQPPVATSIANATGTVGVVFNQVIPAFSDPDGTILSYAVTGLPPGLSFSGGAGGIVGGTPTTAGVYTVTVTATDRGGLSASATYTLTINSIGGPGTNHPPVPPAIPDQHIFSNQAFVYTIPGFTDPDGDVLTYEATGYPAGFSFLWSAAGAGQLTGQTPLSGRFTIRIKATDPAGASATATFLLVVDLPGSAFRLLAPTYNCTTGEIRFNTSGGDGSLITYVAPGITRTSVTDNSGVVEAGLRRDPKPIILQAIQRGITVSYTFDLPSACGGGPRMPGGAFQLLAPSYDCLTGFIRFNTSGGDGSPIVYVAPGITRSAVTDPTGVVEAGLRRDPKPIMLQAIQSGITVSFTFNLPSACDGGPGTTPDAFRLLAPTYNCTTGEIRFNTSGGDGSLITYVAPGITRTSVTDNWGVVEADLRRDPKPILLQAIQRGVTVSYTFDLPSACGGARRLVTEEPSATLSVKVFGNPIQGESVDIEIRGAAGGSLLLNGSDMQGRPIIDQRIEQADEIERHTIRVGNASGIYLLRITTPTESHTIKLIKP